MLSDSKARMVTTDGHRLAYIERILDESIEGTMDALIPKKALLELVKISRDTDGDVSFGEDQNHIYFELEGRLLITRKLSGNFPNYEMVLPKDNDKTATFDLDEMKGAVRRVSLMADERNRSIRLTFREGEVEITAQSSEEGEGNEIVQADYTGEEMQLGFNWQYLQEFLNIVAAIQTGSSADGESSESSPPDRGGVAAVSADGVVETRIKENDGNMVRVKEGNSPTRISFEFKDGNAATQMRIAGDTAYDYKYIVMPLRI